MSIKLLTYVIAIYLAAWSITASAGDTGPLYNACPSPGTIKIDGKLDDAAWQAAIAVPDLHILGQAVTAPSTTTFKMLYDADAIYFAATCEIPAGKHLPKPVGISRDTTIHDGPLYSDECIELYLRPTASIPYYHFILNHAGARYEARGMDTSWNPEWKAGVKVTDAYWQIEARIPWAAMEQTNAPVAGTRWTMNVTRNDLLNHKYHTWANLKNAFHRPDEFVPLIFAESAIGLGPIQLERDGSDLQVTIPWRPAAIGITVGADIELRTGNGSYTFSPSLTSGSVSQNAITIVASNAWKSGTSTWLDYTLYADQKSCYQSPGRLFSAEALPAAAPTTIDPITIRNDEVALTFDRHTGKLLTAANGRGDMQFDFGKGGIPMVELDTVSYISNPRFFRDEDIATIIPDYNTLQDLSVRTTPAGQSIEIKHLISGYMPLTLTITVPPQGSETIWDIHLDNTATQSPSKSLVVHRIRYPYLPTVPGDACGTNSFFAIPETMGRLYPDPAKTLGNRKPSPYPYRLVMGYFDFYGEKGGLYLKTGDLDPMPQTEFIAKSNPKTRKLQLGIQRWPLCWPGQTWSPGPCGLAIHDGDWHTAADMYRTWYHNNFNIPEPPKWLKDANGYVMAGSPRYEFADLPRALDNAMASGISYIELWSEMTGGDTTYHAFPFPNPYMGREEDLKKAIAEVHAKGGHIGFYLNFNTGDPLLGTYLRQSRIAQKIPADIPRPKLDYMKDNWVQQSLMNHTGNYSTWNQIIPGYLDGYWNQCPAAEKWTGFFYYWVIEKWAKEYMADVWYLDSCPVSRGSPCFASDHGHKDPVPEGQSIINFYKRMRAGAPEKFCIMQEYASDRLFPYASHALGLMWHSSYAHPEIVRYTLPEYPLFSGLCNGLHGLKQFYPDEKLTNKDALERVFLIGNRYELGISTLPPDMVDPWRTKMVSLRNACLEEMNYGDFLDNIGLGPLPERVYARIFRRADRGRLAVTLLDRRKDDKTPLTIEVDLDKVSVGAISQVTLKRLDGKSIGLKHILRGNKVSITVPLFEGRVAAILIETEIVKEVK